jgi:hypothetical protein
MLTGNIFKLQSISLADFGRLSSISSFLRLNTNFDVLNIFIQYLMSGT